MNPADLFAREEDPLRLGPGEVLFRAGDDADAMFILLDGAVDVVIGETLVEHAGRGAILGEMALVDHSPRSATVVAREPTTLARLDERRFHRLIQQNPFFAQHVMRVLVERVRRMNTVLG